MGLACPWSEASFFEIYHVPPRVHAKTYFVLIFLIAIESYLIIVSDIKNFSLGINFNEEFEFRFL